jgi:surface protein
MSIADKIRNIYIAKKNIKDALIEFGSDINDDTVLADYPNKINEARINTNIMGDIEIEFAKYYYKRHLRNKAFINSTLNTIDLSNVNIFSTDNDTDLSQYFFNSKAEEITLPANQVAAGSMASMFDGCSNLKQINNINTLSIDVGGLSSLRRCFADCTSLESLDLSSWNLTYVTDVSQMFANCTNLQYLNLANFSTYGFSHHDDLIWIGDRDVVRNHDMFANCRNIKELDLSKITDAKTVQYLVSSLYYNGVRLNPVPYKGPCTIYYSAKLDTSYGSIMKDVMNYYYFYYWRGVY